MPRSGNFYGYPDAGTLGDAFSGDVERQGLSRMSALADCPTARGWIDYSGQDGERAGSVACFVNSDGDGVVAWSRRTPAPRASCSSATATPAWPSCSTGGTTPPKSDFRAG